MPLRISDTPVLIILILLKAWSSASELMLHQAANGLVKAPIAIGDRENQSKNSTVIIRRRALAYEIIDERCAASGN
jgi:hypothetical protein